MAHAELAEQLLKSDEPSIRWKARVKLLGEDRNSSAIKKAGGDRGRVVCIESVWGEVLEPAASKFATEYGSHVRRIPRLVETAIRVMN